MPIKIIPKDKEWIVPLVVTLFLIEGFILTTRSALGGWIFLGSMMYFMLFIITDIISKQKDVMKNLRVNSKERMCYHY